MNGHVFQFHGEIADTKHFSVTIDKLSHHVFKIFLNPTNISVIFDDLTTPSLAKPKKPKLIKGMDEKFEMDIAIFGEDVNKYVKLRNFLKDNLRKLY